MEYSTEQLPGTQAALFALKFFQKFSVLYQLQADDWL
ncbi:uncharacterized protein METZ01_LOCUS9839 [marine metagenome]|uniref:Uncharacterized protein n=1 Tax=marine metagenome TaxID=408172 RepID=A0A381NQV5_9ZZZZ